MRPARVRLVVAKYRWIGWVMGPLGAGVGLVGLRYGEALLAAFGACILLLAGVLTSPPRYEGRRSPGGIIVRFGWVRRLGLLAILGALLFQGPFIAFHVAGVAALTPWLVSGAALAILLLAALGGQTRFVLGSSGIEQIRWPAGPRAIAWGRIAEVSTWEVRGARGILVGSADVKLYVPETMDGIGDLAALLLERAPPEALWRSPRGRERLQHLALEREARVAAVDGDCPRPGEICEPPCRFGGAILKDEDRGSRSMDWRGTEMNKEQAQQRADRVRAFQEELATLERERVLALTESQRAALTAHHGQLLRELLRSFDVDATGQQKQLSWGMRIATVLGAAAISAAVFFLFHRYWGYLATPWQVAVLVSAPLLGIAGVELAARRERSGYVATIVALVAFACFVLDLTMLGQVFSITPSQNAFLAWAAFSLVLAYTYGLALLQVAGILSLLGYLSATVGTWGGCYWISAGQRPENFIAAGLAIAALSFLPHPRRARFPALYRLFGLLAALVAILILGNWGEVSLLPFRPKVVEYVYQVAGFLASGLVIWAGVRQRWPGTANLGSAFLGIFLYTRFFDWWWEWMPRYLFFLVVGLVAILLLLVLKRLRAASQEATP